MNFEPPGKNWNKAEIDKKVNDEFSSAYSKRPTILHKYFTRIGDLKLKPPQWLIDDIIEQGALIGLVGASGCGKSFLAVDMTCSIASDAAFHGRKVRKAKVLYIAGEGQRGITARIVAWCRSNNIDVGQLNLHISANAIPMHDKVAIDQILQEVYDLLNVGLIIIDTLARTFGGYNENST